MLPSVVGGSWKVRHRPFLYFSDLSFYEVKTRKYIVNLSFSQLLDPPPPPALNLLLPRPLLPLATVHVLLDPPILQNVVRKKGERKSSLRYLYSTQKKFWWGFSPSKIMGDHQVILFFNICMLTRKLSVIFQHMSVFINTVHSKNNFITPHLPKPSIIAAHRFITTLIEY